MEQMKAFIAEKAFELAVDFLSDSDSIDKAREYVKTEVIELVNDSSTPWDNVAARAVLKFLGFSDEELIDL